MDVLYIPTCVCGTLSVFVCFRMYVYISVWVCLCVYFFSSFLSPSLFSFHSFYFLRDFVCGLFLSPSHCFLLFLGACISLCVYLYLVVCM